MDIQTILEELKCCAIPNTCHYVHEPKALSCGHFICSGCVENFETNCAKCNKINQTDLNIQGTSQMVQMLIKANLKFLSESLYDKMKDTTNEIKCKNN